MRKIKQLNIVRVSTILDGTVTYEMLNMPLLTAVLTASCSSISSEVV